MTKRRAWVLIAAAVWTFYVWATRIWIIARLSNGAGFKLVHYVLAAISIGFAVAIGWIGLRGLREERSNQLSSGEIDAASRGPAATNVQPSRPSSGVSPTS
jgi:NO-binding membrane sensor protein with MHYT domain